MFSRFSRPLQNMAELNALVSFSRKPIFSPDVGAEYNLEASTLNLFFQSADAARRKIAAGEVIEPNPESTGTAQVARVSSTSLRRPAITTPRSRLPSQLTLPSLSSYTPSLPPAPSLPPSFPSAFPR